MMKHATYFPVFIETIFYFPHLHIEKHALQRNLEHQAVLINKFMHVSNMRGELKISHAKDEKENDCIIKIRKCCPQMWNISFSPNFITVNCTVSQLGNRNQCIERLHSSAIRTGCIRYFYCRIRSVFLLVFAVYIARTTDWSNVHSS